MQSDLVRQYMYEYRYSYSYSTVGARAVLRPARLSRIPYTADESRMLLPYEQHTSTRTVQYRTSRLGGGGGGYNMRHPSKDDEACAIYRLMMMMMLMGGASDEPIINYIYIFVLDLELRL